MSRTLKAADWPLSPGFVTTLRRRGRLPPLFGVASPEVNTLGFGMLAQHLGPERPVCVLQAPPDSDHIRRLSPHELPALCQRYVDALRAVQPVGPYHLIGMCTGAQITLQMTRLLEAAGEQVAFVGLINTWAFYTVSSLHRVNKLANRARYYGRRFSELLRQSPDQQLAEIRRIVAHRAGTEGDAKHAAAPPAQPSAGATAAADTSAEDARVTDEWLVDFGRPANDPGLPPVSAPVTVFRLRPQPFWRVRDDTLGWGRQAREVRVRYLRGDDHAAILREPHVRELASMLAPCLPSCGSGAGSKPT